MKTIYKYPVSVGPNLLELPIGAKIVHFAAQGDSLFLWAEIPSPDSRTITRPFRVYGTGFAIEPDYEHVATCFSRDGLFVWHLYERV